jgi:hypothetical protein
VLVSAVAAPFKRTLAFITGALAEFRKNPCHTTAVGVCPGSGIANIKANREDCAA